MIKKLDKSAAEPQLINWEEKAKNYKGWNLVFANQCPWHAKAVEALMNHAMDVGIDLKVKELKTPAEAKKAPSGFGVFSLVKDGELMEDHYISETRFKNIIAKVGI